MPETVQAPERPYIERMRPPLWWWIIAAGLWATTAVAVGAYLGLGWAAAATVAVGVGSGALVVQQNLTIRVDDRGLRVGRNQLEWPWVASVVGLGTEATAEHLRSPEHHDDFLAVRPYVERAVIVTLDDPADPHHRWIVSSRRPEALAVAIAIRGDVPRTSGAVA